MLIAEKIKLRDELKPYVMPSMMAQSSLFYIVTIYRHMNASFAQREHAHAHYRALIESQDDLPHANIAFWHLNASGNLDLIDYVLR